MQDLAEQVDRGPMVLENDAHLVRWHVVAFICQHPAGPLRSAAETAGAASPKFGRYLFTISSWARIPGPVCEAPPLRPPECGPAGRISCSGQIVYFLPTPNGGTDGQEEAG